MNVRATFYAQIEPELNYNGTRVVGAKLARATIRKPNNPIGGTLVVKITVDMPTSLLEPVETEPIELMDMAEATPVVTVEAGEANADESQHE